MQATAVAETELWRAYQDSRDTQLREQLFLAHVQWARAVGVSVYRRVWSYAIDRSDCIQNATVGLLEAMDRYDPARGIAFRTYATPRVRGAVFNGLRAQIGERSVAPPQGRYAERVETLDDEGQGWTLDGFIDVVAGLGVGFLTETAYEALVDERDASFFAESGALDVRVMSAVTALPARHRRLIEAHYFHHLPFVELAQQWGLTKGRISQLHRDALTQLRRDLKLSAHYG